MMLTISKKANHNYLAKVVKLKGLQKHSNADRLQCVNIDFQNVITGLDAKDGDIYVYFPVECQINEGFLAFINGFREKELNYDKEKVGFFEKNCRVKALRLRGEKSMGFILPFSEINEFFQLNLSEKEIEKLVNTEFDTVNNIEICKKYIIKEQISSTKNKSKKVNKNFNRLVENQVRLHVDTKNIRRYARNIHPSDEITVTYKVHGTSFWVGNLLTKKKLNFLYKFLKFLGIKVQDTEYDLIYGSRRVVKNKYLKDPKNKNHFYSYDLWKDIKDTIGNYIPEGYTLYGECVGYTKDGTYIQKEYDYGCSEGENKLFIYRITYTNSKGLVQELSTKQIEEFCAKAELDVVHNYYSGIASDMYADIPLEGEEDKSWEQLFIEQLEKDYNEKDCWLCKNKVPEEGICIRKESLYNFEVYKLKSFRFLEQETKQLDSGDSDMESEN